MGIFLWVLPESWKKIESVAEKKGGKWVRQGQCLGERVHGEYGVHQQPKAHHRAGDVIQVIEFPFTFLSSALLLLFFFTVSFILNLLAFTGKMGKFSYLIITLFWVNTLVEVVIFFVLKLKSDLIEKK